jgi:6-pyruvoyltetrahydropterin/6-carboxytetrahydropterin synthase
MHLIRIEITFDSGHRLLDYEGKCAFPHGHTYRTEVFLKASSLDSVGLVFDFTELRGRVKAWIDENWDHAFLTNSRDTELIAGLKPLAGGRLYQFDGENPSCEVMSRELYKKVTELCGVAPAKVRLWESTNQYAEFQDAEFQDAEFQEGE